MKSLIDQFESARLSGVPLVVIRTADQNSTQELIAERCGPAYPILSWNAVDGIVGVNDSGQKGAPGGDTVNFVDAMCAIKKVAAGVIVIAHNAHRQLISSEPGATAAAVQAVSNLRDVFKRNFRTLVLLAPDFVPPAELQRDVVILDHDLPTAADLDVIVGEITKAAEAQGMTPIDSDTRSRIVDAVSGLSAFEAEQVVSMSATQAGIDVANVWARKCVTINQTPGLSVWPGRERFADIVGQTAIKRHLQRRIDSARARRPIGVVVWIDEIDKALANVESDTSGVRMYQLRTLLTAMEDNEWPGFVAAGVAGGGKSMMAKAFGNEAGVPTLALDLGATEDSLVGQSEANLRRAIAVIKAVGRGHAYFIATSNAATIMRPELQRRFTDGMWMFDLITPAERKVAWSVYTAKYGLKEQPLPADDAWTAAEIRNVCRFAWDCGCTLIEAAEGIVPMAVSRASEIESLRRYAHGRFVDAEKGGPYRYEAEPMRPAMRAITLPPMAVDVLTQMKES